MTQWVNPGSIPAGSSAVTTTAYPGNPPAPNPAQAGGGAISADVYQYWIAVKVAWGLTSSVSFAGNAVQYAELAPHYALAAGQAGWPTLYQLSENAPSPASAGDCPVGLQ